MSPDAAWHALEAEVLEHRLTVDSAQGLSTAEAATRRAHHGPNALQEAPPRPLWHIGLHQFTSPLVALLGVAGLVALALGHASDAAVIGAVVLLNAFIGAVQEGRAERSMATLKRLAALQARVRREGREQVLPARELVPGDVLLLAAGDAVGADARVIEAASLEAAEAALTGESVPVPKQPATLPADTGLADRHNLVHAGTHITAGRGVALVVATGAHTEVGRIAALTAQAIEPPTPLERRLRTFGRQLVAAGAVLWAAVMALGLWRGLPLDEVLMVAISQMVSMVPEGLPVATTIALAVGMQRMAERGALIRRLSAVEALGSVNVICSDKTGTLTRNEMTAVAVWLPASQAADNAGEGQAARTLSLDAQAPQAQNDAALGALLRAAVLCNDAAWHPSAQSEHTPTLGDPTEAALLVLAQRAGGDVPAWRAACERISEQPFDAAAQCMLTVHRDAAGAYQGFIKGSPEAVLRLCAPAELDAEAVHAAVGAMTAQALRVLAFGTVDVRPGESCPPTTEAWRHRVRLLGLIGQIDPPREEARTAVAACREAGIRTLMVTGDHPATGLAIARQLGIAEPHSRAISGLELERLNEAQLRAALQDRDRPVAVFARVQPAQKLRLVQALQAQGELVAMTGDGVNDAPALAQADVGVAMGRGGTEVAKGASRIVLTDDRFDTLVHAVAEGRAVVANLRRVILFLFATSLDEVLVLLLSLLAGWPLPLAAVQVLWINVVTEATLTVNLVMGRPDAADMRRPPMPREAPLLDRALAGRALRLAATSAAVALAWYGWRLQHDVPIDALRTELFTLVAMCQWFNLINVQSDTHGFFSRHTWANRWVAGGLLLSVALQAAVLFFAPLGELFHTTPLSLHTLAALGAVAALVLMPEEVRKAWKQRPEVPQSAA